MPSEKQAENLQAEIQSVKSSHMKRVRARSTEAFEKSWGQMNPEQRVAAETLEGPVMCIAGPGTGKTQVIALRIANILRKTQMRPGNILCLTFSTNAVTEMRERLRKFIGPDAYGISVKNFHGFCNELIMESPMVFDQWSALEQISDVERYREVNKIIDQQSSGLALVNPKQPHQRTGEIIGRISQLKREGKTDRAALLEVASKYESVMSCKSREGTKAHEKNLLMVRKFREFLDVFSGYQEMLADTQRYDYEDMILRVVDALQEEEWLLASLQERYQYILVDEFQDTNGAQLKLIELLTTYAHDQSPNLFVVGDDDQAIYRFQGANLTNILKLCDRFPKAPIIALTKSYRCVQPILDAAGSLIVNNTERLVGKVEGLQKDLQSMNKNECNAPRLLLSPSDMTEPWMIADLVEERRKKGVSLDDIAILVQTNRELKPIYEVLSARDIPVHMRGKVDLLSAPLVQQTLAILKAIENPHDSAILAAAIACEEFHCHPADLGTIFALRREKKSSLMDTLLTIDGEDAPTLRDPERIIHARDVLLDLHQKQASRTILETLESVLSDTGLLAEARGEGDKPFDVLKFAALQEFFDRIKYRAYEQPNFSFEMFLSDIQYYEHPEYRDVRLSYDLPHLTEEGVQLMTAHQSKGLEFDTVILANFRHGHWDKRRNPSSLSIPEDLLFGWEKDQKSFERNQDERRVTYVAMTRAKRELIFTCPEQMTSNDKIRDVSPSAFFAEAGDLLEEKRELKSPKEASEFLFIAPRHLDSEMRTFLENRLENFSLSVTALNHFLQDPKLFLERDLLQIPRSKESNLVYGNAVHDALKKWGLMVQSGKSPTEEDFLAAFRAYLDDREVLTEKDKSRLRALGEQALPRYFDARLKEVHPVIRAVEYPVNAYLDDIPLKGKLDRIDLISPEGSNAIVIDFKTGQPKTELQIREGDYFRQLTFYALLLSHQKKIPIRPVQYTLDFIGEREAHPIERSFAITEHEQKELEEIVRAVWAKILALDFTPI